MVKESIFLEHVGDSPHMKILEHFIEERDFEYSLTDLLESHVSWGTLNIVVPKLEKIGIIV